MTRTHSFTGWGLGGAEYYQHVHQQVEAAVVGVQRRQRQPHGGGEALAAHELRGVRLEDGGDVGGGALLPRSGVALGRRGAQRQQQRGLKGGELRHCELNFPTPTFFHATFPQPRKSLACQFSA